MLINADLRLPAAVDSTCLPWVPSPLPGVERRMLERDGGEVARATSIVRYAPGSSFAPHTHGGGEEFLVLEGTFSDESGDYPAGWYVRNPPGSSHTPSSAPGCTILVKLRQMRPQESEHVRIDTRAPEGWVDGPPGVRLRPLFADGSETVEMLRLAPGAALPETGYPGGVEILVVEGAIRDGEAEHPAGSWLRRPAGARYAATSGGGALIWRKRGHLALA
jgi:anti-sigma factor ChrR (cupin superfamily)